MLVTAESLEVPKEGQNCKAQEKSKTDKINVLVSEIESLSNSQLFDIVQHSIFHDPIHEFGGSCTTTAGLEIKIKQ